MKWFNIAIIVQATNKVLVIFWTKEILLDTNIFLILRHSGKI